MSRKLALVLAVAMAAAAQPMLATAQRISYAESSSKDKLESRLDLQLGSSDLGLGANMRLIGQNGETKVLPRLTSSWSSLRFLDVKTVLDYGNLNAASLSPKLGTNIVVTTGTAFIDRIEATLERADSVARQSLGIRFTELDTDLDVLGGKPLALRADLGVKRSGGESLASSSLSSSWGLGRALTMQSVLRLDETAASGFGRSALETKLVYRSPFPFIDRFEGEILDGPDRRRQSIALLLPALSRGDPYGSSISLTGKASLRETLDAYGTETRSVGFETSIKGILPPLLGGQNAISVKLERGLGTLDDYSSSLAYDHAWSPGRASIGLNFKMLRDVDDISPSMDLSWSASF